MNHSTQSGSAEAAASPMQSEASKRIQGAAVERVRLEFASLNAKATAVALNEAKNNYDRATVELRAARGDVEPETPSGAVGQKTWRFIDEDAGCLVLDVRGNFYARTYSTVDARVIAGAEEMLACVKKMLVPYEGIATEAFIPETADWLGKLRSLVAQIGGAK